MREQRDDEWCVRVYVCGGVREGVERTRKRGGGAGGAGTSVCASGMCGRVFDECMSACALVNELVPMNVDCAWAACVRA